MTLGTIGFFPGSTNIGRMFKFKIIPDIGVFHYSFLALTNNIMTEITIA
jgi:hypothetical protein